MKRIVLVALMIIGLFTSKLSFSQDVRDRFEITGYVEVKGKKANIAVTSLNYSFDNKGSIGAGIYTDKKDSLLSEYKFYGSVSLHYTNDLLMALSQNAPVNVTIIVNDKFGKKPTRKYEFKETIFSYSETATTYNEDQYGQVNIGLQAKKLVVDGIAIQ
jgi:hypothetical protein